MALKDFLAGPVPVVHTVPEAVAPFPAGSAAAFFCPAAVAERLEAPFPDRIEIVRIDIALGKGVAVDVGAAADPSVDEDGGDVDAGMAEVADVPDLLLVAAEETFAAERGFHRTAGTPLLPDEFHQGNELRIRQVHLFFTGGAADGNNREQTPLRDAETFQKAVNFRQFLQIPPIDAGYDIECEAGIGSGQPDRFDGAGESVGIAPHPVMVLLQTVKTDGQSAHSGLQEPALLLFRVEIAVRDHAPAEPAPADFPAGLFEVGPLI